MRVAYTLEQCWHRVPGGTGVAAMRVAEAMAARAGRHAARRCRSARPRAERAVVAADPDRPSARRRAVAVRPVAAPRTGRRSNGRPGPIDVAHATTLIPCATDAPLVVTVHDLAFLHDPSQFTRRGNSIFRRSLDHIRRRADLVLCSSQATMDDCVAAGVAGRSSATGAARCRGRSRSTPPRSPRVAALYRLPERYLLFVGTVEPRKNLRGLVEAVAVLDEPLPLVVAGAEGWGDVAIPAGGDVRFIGFVPAADLGGLYAGAEVFCYPSEREGYGLPVLEAMAQGTPVVTSRGTGDRGGRRWRGRARRSARPRRHRQRHRRGRRTAASRCRRWCRPRRRGNAGSETARLTADAYRELC